MHVKQSVIETEKIVNNFGKHGKLYFWNYIIPASKKLINYNWDLIFIMSSALSDLQFESQHKQLKTSLNFLEKSSAFKIALPQDEYYASDDLEDLLIHLKVDIIVTLHIENISNLYPRLSINKQAIFVSGYTTYNDFYYIELFNKFSTLETRKKFDLVYRASEPTIPNPLAVKKFNLGNRLNSVIQQNNFNFKTDLYGSILTGNKWYEFLRSSRATLISPSGSNVIFRRIEQLESARSLFKKYKDIDLNIALAEVGVLANDKVVLTALSPRNFEAAALGVIQVFIKPPNLEIDIDPKCFLTLDEDFKDLDKLNYEIRNKALVEKIKQDAFDTLVMGQKYNFNGIWNLIMNLMQKENRVGGDSNQLGEKNTLDSKKFYFMGIHYEKYFYKQFIKLLKKLQLIKLKKELP